MDNNTTSLTADQLLGQYLAKSRRPRKSKTADHSSSVSDRHLASSLGLGGSQSAESVSADSSTVSKAAVGSVPGRRSKLRASAKGSNSVGSVDAESTANAAASMGASARPDSGISVGLDSGISAGTSVSAELDQSVGVGSGIGVGVGVGAGADASIGAGVGAGLGVGVDIAPAAPASGSGKNPAPAAKRQARPRCPKTGRILPHQPTEEMRQRVRMLVWAGARDEEIAKALGMTVATLRRYYGHELDQSVREANALVADRLLRKALDGDTTCMLFWLKCRAGWREYAPLPPSLPNGAPKELEQLSTEELRRLRDVMLKVQAEHHRERDLLVQSITPAGKPN